MENLEVKLAQLQGELKTYFEKAADEKKSFGSILDETKTSIATLQKQVDAIDSKLQKPAAGAEQKSLSQELKENEAVQRLMRDRRGTALVTIKGGLAELERKTTITSSAISTSGNDLTDPGVISYERVPGIVDAARRQLFVEDLLTKVPTSLPLISYVKVENDIADASPQVEGSAKFENALSFATAEASVKTIATWIPATRQILEDFSGLEGYIRSSLMYAVRKETEEQILTGSNTGEDLNGLITQATAFDTNLLVASDGWEYADMVGRAIQQVQAANEVSPNFVVLNPAIWWGIRLQKTSTGEYIYGSPTNGAGNFSLFGLSVIPSNAVSSTQFLVGSSAPAHAVIRERMGMEVEISTEHSTYFTQNMVAIRAERRLALVVFRPSAYITGTFTQSPA